MADINIVISGENDGTKAAADTARTALKGVGDEAKTTAGKFKEHNRESAASAAAMKRFADEAKDLRVGLNKLYAEYGKLGDQKLVKQIDDQERALRRVEQRTRSLAKAEEERGRRLRDTFSFQRSGNAGAGIIGELLGAGTGAVGTLGRAGSTIAGGAASVGASSGPIGAAIAAYIASMAAPAVPFAGAAAGAGVIGGAAGGVVAGGIAGAIKGDDLGLIEQRYSALADRVQKRWIDATKGFGGPLIKAADDFDAALKDVDIEGIFKGSERFIEPLSQGLIGFVRNTVKGFDDLVAAADPIIQVFKEEFPELGGDLANMFSNIADGADGAGKAFRDILDIIGLAIRLTGAWIEVLSDLYGWLRDTPWGDALEWIFDKMSSDEPKSFGKKIETGVKEPLDEATEAAKRHKEALDNLFDTYMSVDESALKVKESWTNLNKELREGKRTLDANSEAGQANVGVILAHINVLQRDREANIAAGQSQSVANAKFNEGVGAIRALLAQLGYAPGAIDALINKWMQLYNTPNITKTYTTVYRSDGAPGMGHSRDLPGRTHSGGVATANKAGTFMHEMGWELVKLPSGAIAYPHNQSKQIMRDMAGGARGEGGHGGGTAVLSVADGADSETGAFIQSLINRGIISVTVRS